MHAIDFGVREASLLQEQSQPLVLVEHPPRRSLDLSRGFDADRLAGSVFGLEVLEVFLAAGAGAALVVADAGEVCPLLFSHVTVSKVLLCCVEAG